MNSLKLTLFTVLAALLGFGCEPASSKPPEKTVPYSLASQTIAHLHWLGKKQLAATTNAAAFMRIWDEPESAAVEKEALDKLSTAPWRLFPHVATTNSAAAPLLRALLDDCVQMESYLEITAATNQTGEIAFAIQLPPERAALWQTNLATVLESLTGLHAEPTDKGWTLIKHELPNRLELTRVGGWVVVGIGQDNNALFGDFVARILRSQTPVTSGAPGFWVDAEMDLARIFEAFKLAWKLPANFPKIALQTIGDGQNLQTRGILNFSQSLGMTLEPWRIPLSLIHPPISSLTAIRGIQPWLSSLKAWNDLKIGIPPDQFFAWAILGAPQMTFLAVPLQAASNRVAHISDNVMEKYSSQFATNDSVSFEKAPDLNGLVWKGIPFLTPFLKSVKTDEGEFAFAGLFPNRPSSPIPVPPGMLQEIVNRTNLVYYDWELTGNRIESLLYVGQFFRFVSHKAQLPAAAGVSWMSGVATNFGNCVTEIMATGPERLSFVRSSSCGLSALEINVLADWFESPQFPCGFYTLIVPPPARGKPPVRTTSQPGQWKSP